MEAIRNLLDTWSGYEGERCQKNGAIYRIQKDENLAGSLFFSVGTIDGPTIQDLTDIQVAVQQAIENKKWDWNLKRNYDSYTAIVDSEDGEEIWAVEAGSDTAVHALLSAYTKALEQADRP